MGCRSAPSRLLHGGVSERPKEAALKAARCQKPRGFKSLRLRHSSNEASTVRGPAGVISPLRTACGIGTIFAFDRYHRRGGYEPSAESVNRPRLAGRCPLNRPVATGPDPGGCRAVPRYRVVRGPDATAGRGARPSGDTVPRRRALHHAPGRNEHTGTTGSRRRSVTVIYADTSALLKRIVAEPESAAVRRLLAEQVAAGDVIAASSLAWLEVWRSLRRAGSRCWGWTSSARHSCRTIRQPRHSRWW